MSFTAEYIASLSQQLPFQQTALMYNIDFVVNVL